MSSLSEQRCFNHAAREAVARCPECHRYYCRECVVEHEDRVLCAACLKQWAQPRSRKRPLLDSTLQLLQCLAGLLIAALFFWILGRGLLLVPTAFHEGTVWETTEQEGR